MTKTLNRSPIRAFTGAVLGIAIWYGGVGGGYGAFGGVQGNDTGGIIPWAPGIDHAARQMAAAHCGSYRKYALITSVRPWYGDYIGFVCRRPVRWGPVLQ